MITIINFGQAKINGIFEFRLFKQCKSYLFG